MKKIIIALVTAITPMLFFAQDTDRESVEDHNVRKGFYGNLNINSVSPFDNTYNLGLSGGMHFSERFHIGLSYMGGKGETKRFFPNDTTGTLKADLKYRSFGIELGYEIPLEKHFSIMPYFNQSFMKYSYTLPSDIYIAGDKKDNFLNTQVGAKLFFVANENIRIGANLGYSFANGADLIKTKSDDLSGMSIGLTLQYNYFLPKW